MSSEIESWLSLSHFGKVSAHLRRFDGGESTFIVNFGFGSAAYLPYSEAVALRADLDEALAQFHREQQASEDGDHAEADHPEIDRGRSQ